MDETGTVICAAPGSSRPGSAASAQHDHRARLALLSETASRLLQSDRPEPLIEDLCTRVMRHIECDVFFNFLLDEDAGRLRLNAYAGVPPRTVRALEWLDLGVAVSGCVARDGTRMVAERIQEVPDPRTDLVRSLGIRAYCCHPLLTTGGKVIGTLSFGTMSRDTFPDDVVEMMKSVADLVAVAVDRVVAHETERRRLVTFNAELESRVAARTEELRALATELTQTERRERRRLATALHENVQQLIVAARMQAGVLKRERLTRAGRGALEHLDGALLEAVSASRSVALEMSPPVLHDAGLAPALSWLARRMGERHGLVVEVTVDGRAEPSSEDARALLFECVRELLLNVHQHSGVREARVAMGMDADGRTRIVVEDAGRGFDPSPSRAAHASGFGIFSMQQRLGYLGGRVEVDSATGRGTRVALVAPGDRPEPEPLLDEPAGDGAQAACASVRRRRHPIRVLVVDDHEVVRQGIAGLLRLESDFEVVGEASNGREAVEQSARLGPDVVIMDVSMPGMSGVEATRAILADRPRTRVLGLSMHDRSEMAASMVEAGAVAYLTKGGPADRFVEAIRRAAR